MMNRKDLRTYPVQDKPCRSCPFAGSEPVRLLPERYQQILSNLVNSQQHLCHSVDNKAICRGGREIQLRWLCSIGALSEPTDEAFDAAINEVMDKYK
jgi:hypothetical protein